MLFEGLQFTEKQVHCRAFYVKFSEIFKAHSNIVWSSNLVALQPVDGESVAPVNFFFFFFENSRVEEIHFVVMQATDVESRHFSYY